MYTPQKRNDAILNHAATKTSREWRIANVKLFAIHNRGNVGQRAVRNRLIPTSTHTVNGIFETNCQWHFRLNAGQSLPPAIRSLYSTSLFSDSIAVSNYK